MVIYLFNKKITLIIFNENFLEGMFGILIHQVSLGKYQAHMQTKFHLSSYSHVDKYISKHPSLIRTDHPYLSIGTNVLCSLMVLTVMQIFFSHVLTPVLDVIVI